MNPAKKDVPELTIAKRMESLKEELLIGGLYTILHYIFYSYLFRLGTVLISARQCTREREQSFVIALIYDVIVSAVPRFLRLSTKGQFFSMSVSSCGRQYSKVYGC